MKEIFFFSPFELPDYGVLLKNADKGDSRAIAVLPLTSDIDRSREALRMVSADSLRTFGVYLTSKDACNIDLPTNVTKVFVPYSLLNEFSNNGNRELYCLVNQVDDVFSAMGVGIKNIVLKGSEAGGRVGNDSTFILFQKVMKLNLSEDIKIYLQGGLGVNTASSALAMGASGVVLDDQLALFPECKIPRELKTIFRTFSGSETALIAGFRLLQRNNSPRLPENPRYEDILPYLGGLSVTENYIPMGQGIALAADLADKYGSLNNLVKAISEVAYANLHQAKSKEVLAPGSPFAQSMGIDLPLFQGPMARVSDSPEFALRISESGALPFVAMSMLRGESARKMLSETSYKVGDRPWGVGILGFAPKELKEEQIRYILDAKPSAIIIAGGTPSQAKIFEKENIRVFLHVPSSELLDQFVKGGAHNFIFEGRECGGHIGPLSSFVLWEKQINRLLKEDDLSPYHICFAGGIHDAFSSAFVSIMSVKLAVRGAKIGIVMGSAYLFTREAVEAGAILEEYQEQLIENDQVAVLESAPGHETCSLKTPYTDFFEKEKARLSIELSDKKEVWSSLEQMNLGRLRIASKGIERVGDELKNVNPEEQKKKGMYMVGPVASLRGEQTTLADLNRNVVQDNNTLIKSLPELSKPQSKQNPLDIAIVGMAGVFPQAADLDEFWKNILVGKDCVTEVPDERWKKEKYFRPEGGLDLTDSKWGGFIPTIDFDPLEFGIPPQSLASIECSQLIALLLAKRALEDAGYEISEMDGENTSVIIAAEGGGDLADNYNFRSNMDRMLGYMPEVIKEKLPSLSEDSFPGVLVNVISGRISNRLNLGGRNYTVNAACASSFAALDIACQELSSQRADMVLVGGVDLHNSIRDYLLFSSTHALSNTGRCASFDAEANGTVLGEAVSMLVVKRLEDAVRDGNKIYSVIKGLGGSSDGKSLGLTAPSKKGQMRAFKRAYDNAGISPSEVGLVEAHGTGTIVGDKTELSAMTELFLDYGATIGQTHLGSVKTQIGHTKCAAGLAGLIKASLSVYYGLKPPTIHLKKPNQFYSEENSPFVFNRQTGIWNDEKRVAGVSAFGFGGTNFHVVIENYAPEVNHASSMSAWPSELFVFRGDTKEEALAQVRKTADLLRLNDSLGLRNISYSLATYNEKPIQISVVASDSEELLSRIESVLNDQKGKGIYYLNPIEGKVAFLFSGQGSQRVNMARDLMVAFPSMRRLFSENEEYEKIVYPNALFDDARRKQLDEVIKDTRNAQPLLGIVDWSIAAFLQSLGIEPDMLAGHSYGELPALCFAGAFDPGLLVDLSRKRAESILDAVGEDLGKMVAVNTTEAELDALLSGEKDIWAVNYNSTKQIVVAGTTPAVTSFIQKLKEKGISCKELNVACAFHTPLLERSPELYRKVLENVAFNDISIPVWSNTTSDLYPVTAEEIKERLCEHLVNPVRFAQEIEKMYADGARIFIETGPGRVLTTFAGSTLGDNIATIQTESDGEQGVTFILHSLAKYLSTGKKLDLEKLYKDRGVTRIDLDSLVQYRKNPVIWHVNGQYAYPDNGIMPPNGAYPIVEPIALSIGEKPEQPVDSTRSADQVMIEYLQSMRMMIHAQHEVMMNYFGVNPQPPVGALSPNGSSFSSSVLKSHSSVSNNVVDIPVEKESDQKSNFSQADIKPLILNLISEKTGYPVDMLNGDMDMEADLSIDSIKRMEIIGSLRERLTFTTDISEDALGEMASIKTINALVGWLTKNIVFAQPEQAPEQIKKAQPTVKALSSDDYKTILLDTVSSKTGYPVDMLQLDLDMEADLSIDSIKRMEIVGDLREKLNIQIDDAEGNVIEKMSSLKTLRELLDLIEELLIPTLSNPPVPTGTPEQLTVQETPGVISRLVPRFEKNIPLLSDSDMIRGLRFALSESDVSSAVKELLESNGAKVVVVNSSDRLDDYDGLIIINTTRSEKLRYTIQDVVKMIKGVNRERIRWVYFFSDLTADADRSDLKILSERIEGFPGLAKSLAREVPGTIFRSISISSYENRADLPQILLNEILAKDESPEVLYEGKDRFKIGWIAQPIETGGASQVEISKDSVVLVLGGAQGITAELIASFSVEYPCNYILVGRTPQPSTEVLNKYENLNTKDEIREALIREKDLKTPAAIEKRVSEIFKANQVAKTIRRIEKSGSRVVYESLDLKDSEKVRQFMRDLYTRYGRIDGVIHGAGLLEDKLFTDKSEESFDKVYTTKVNPLRAILGELRPDVKCIVLFSSIASVYGNRGQTDYAAANSVMDYLALSMGPKSDVRLLTINWGPWKGAGMVSDTLAKEYEKRKISMIPLLQGSGCFMDELKYGKDRQVLIMAGDKW